MGRQKGEGVVGRRRRGEGKMRGRVEKGEGRRVRRKKGKG